MTEPKLSKPPDLSSDEKATVADMLQSDGWRALQKIMNWQKGVYLHYCANVEKDQRFYQGLFNGLQMAEILAVQAGTKQEAPKAEEVQDPAARLTSIVANARSETESFY